MARRREPEPRGRPLHEVGCGFSLARWPSVVAAAALVPNPIGQESVVARILHASSLHVPVGDVRPLLRLVVHNFRSLREAEVELRPLNVLVGPNGAGKTNLLRVIEFLGDSARDDLGPAIEKHHGYASLRFRGASRPAGIRIRVTAKVTTHASENAPDEYQLAFSRSRRLRNRERSILQRTESFTFKRVGGRGRRITVEGRKLEVIDKGRAPRKRGLAGSSLALSTLPRLGDAEGGREVAKVAELFTTFRVFDVDVQAARRPVDVRAGEHLEPDASNLSGFLAGLHERDPDVFRLLVEDAKFLIPGLVELRLRPIGGAMEGVVVDLIEAGLSGATSLGDASFGTIRALALLALLHDPHPPLLTCVEEIDHGLHPHAFDRLVERLRSATRRTQILVTTHSPALVNRLRPKELIVCERDPRTGESLIPAVDPEEVREQVDASEYSLGELWFSGALGGGLP